MPSVRVARALRRRPTDAERHLRSIVRGNRFAGYKFRRQHPVGPYVLDFYCHNRRLVIEVDGSYHDDRRDAARDEWLTIHHDLRVLRFSNRDVLTNPEGVTHSILTALESTR